MSSHMQASSQGALVGVIMGSQSDWDTMKQVFLTVRPFLSSLLSHVTVFPQLRLSWCFLQTCETLRKLHVPYEASIVSAHRTPERLFHYAKTARDRGTRQRVHSASSPFVCFSQTLSCVLCLRSALRLACHYSRCWGCSTFAWHGVLAHNTAGAGCAGSIQVRTLICSLPLLSL